MSKEVVVWIKKPENLLNSERTSTVVSNYPQRGYEEYKLQVKERKKELNETEVVLAFEKVYCGGYDIEEARERIIKELFK
jgi:hypothetical protein